MGGMSLRVVLVDDDARFRAMACRALIADGVEICVGDKVIARGELCDDGTGEGRLAVRILGTQTA